MVELRKNGIWCITKILHETRNHTARMIKKKKVNSEDNSDICFKASN